MRKKCSHTCYNQHDIIILFVKKVFMQARRSIEIKSRSPPTQICPQFFGNYKLVKVLCMIFYKQMELLFLIFVTSCPIFSLDTTSDYLAASFLNSRFQKFKKGGRRYEFIYGNSFIKYY